MGKSALPAVRLSSRSRPKHDLSLASQVRIPESIAVHDLQGELLLLNTATGVCVKLDPMGTRMWQLIQEHHALHKILDALLREYDVMEAQCKQDLLGFVARMLKQGFVETGGCRDELI